MAETEVSQADNGGKTQEALDFQTESRPFASILKTDELPVIVQYDVAQPLDEQFVASPFNHDEPLLVQSRHRVRRIRARSVQFELETKTFIDGDCDAIIPEVYQGWFAVFGEPSTQTKQPIVPHYRRISQLAISTCKRFLVGGDQPISALLIEKAGSDNINLHPVQIYPGIVFQKGHIFTTSSLIKIKKRFRKKEKIQEDKYLSVSDPQGYKFFISCETEGLFFVLSTGTTAMQVPILRTEEVLQRYALPVVVKLVHGRIPPPPMSFSGTMLFLTSDLVSVAMAAGVRTPKPMFFEILQNSSLPFLLTLKAPAVRESEEYKNVIFHHKKQVDFCLQCIRFQNKDSDLPRMSTEYGTKTSDFADSADVAIGLSCTGIDICSVTTEESMLFPCSPKSTKTCIESDSRNSNTVLSLNLSQIKRTATYDRPVNRNSDIIPSRNKVDSRVSNNATGVRRQSVPIADTTRRSYSESGSSSSSCASQPSFSDTPPEVGIDAQLPPPTADLLKSNTHGDAVDALEDVPDELDEYFGVWTSSTSRSTLSGRGGKNAEVTNRYGSNTADTPTTSDSTNRKASSHYYDENGYVVATEMLQGRDGERTYRPASYMSASEHDYDYIFGETEELTENKKNNSSNDLTPVAVDGGRDLRISSKSHVYVNPDDFDDNRMSVDVPRSIVSNDSSFSTYVDAESTAIYVEESGYQNILDLEKEKDNDPQEKNAYVNQNEMLKPSDVSDVFNCVLESEKPSLSDSGEAVLLDVAVSSVSEKVSKYMNLQQISEASTSRHRFLDELRQQGVRRETEERMQALEYGVFLSITSAEDPIEKLNELLPNISKSDIFKIAVCLKGL